MFNEKRKRFQIISNFDHYKSCGWWECSVFIPGSSPVCARKKSHVFLTMCFFHALADRGWGDQGSRTAAVLCIPCHHFLGARGSLHRPLQLLQGRLRRLEPNNLLTKKCRQKVFYFLLWAPFWAINNIRLTSN